jgi:hypothetical protein
MKFNSFFSGCLTTCAAVVAAAFIYNKHYSQSVGGATDIRTDTVVKFISTPILKDSVVLRYEIVKVPVYDTTYIYAEHALPDTVTVPIPITQKVYQDSTYQAWVSGYMSSLDSIRIYQPVTSITNTVIQYKAKRWSVGPQIGIGATSTKISPYIGIGVTYNIFSW